MGLFGGEGGFFGKKKAEEAPIEEEQMSEGEPIIDEEPPADAMSSESEKARADLEKEFGSDLPPPLSDEEAEKKLRQNTDMQGSSAAQRKEGKEKEGGA
jgi:hypothetical protein